MFDAEKNVMDVREEDRDFIRALTLISSDKKLILKGILIGMSLQERSEPVCEHGQTMTGKQMTIM